MASTSKFNDVGWLGHELIVLNSPEWGRLKKQIFGPGDKYHWESSWTFGTL